MNAELFAVAISNLLFGFIAGMAVEAFSSKYRIEMLNDTIQNGIDIMFKKDKRNDELTSELETIKSQYNQLYKAVETSRQAFDGVKSLPPPISPLMRCDHYVDHEDLPRLIESAVPQTPASTCVPSSMD
jgi:hypothetical protein